MELSYDTLYLFHFFSAATILLPLFLAIYRRKYLASGLTLLGAYLVIKAILEITATILADQGINNLFLQHFHTPLQYVLLTLTFERAFTNSILKKVIILSIPLFLGFAILDAFYLEGTANFNSIPGGVEALLLIILALSYFYKVFREALIEHLLKHSMFLISSGILIYFSGNLFLFILSNYILAESKEMLHELWSIHSVLAIILNVFFALGLWFSKEKQIYH